MVNSSMWPKDSQVACLESIGRKKVWTNLSEEHQIDVVFTCETYINEKHKEKAMMDVQSRLHEEPGIFKRAVRNFETNFRVKTFWRMKSL